MDRSRNILKYLTEAKTIICKTCIDMPCGMLPSVSCFYHSCAITRNNITGIYTSSPPSLTAPSFDNTKHTIIATLDFCKGKEFGCNIDCKTNCMVPIVQERFKK